MSEKLTAYPYFGEQRYTMITLIANDDARVTLSESVAIWSPYIMDAFWGDTFNTIPNKTLDVPFATGAQLRILKQVLEAKDTESSAVSFIPARGKLIVGKLPVAAPPFVVLIWPTRLDSVMNSFKEDEIIALLHIANDMCMWDLRTGVICLMLHKIITEQYNFEEFFAKYSHSNLAEVIYKIYNSAINDKLITNALDNDYYVHHDSSYLD